MVTRTRTEVKGLRGLGEAMRGLSEDINRKIARAGTNAAAQIVKKAAIQNAPISDGPHQLGVRKSEVVQRGNLKRNIIVKKLPPGQTTLTSEHIVTVRHGSGRAPNDAFYARFIEFGTLKMAAQPFLRPALAENLAPATEAMRSRLKSRIDKANRTTK